MRHSLVHAPSKGVHPEAVRITAWRLYPYDTTKTYYMVTVGVNR
jgi:hypothetical protein